MRSPDDKAETLRFTESLLLALRNVTLMGLALPAQLAQASWHEVERIFDLPEAKSLPYGVIETYVSLMMQSPTIDDERFYHRRLQRLDEALTAQFEVPSETVRGISSPVFGA